MDEVLVVDGVEISLSLQHIDASSLHLARTDPSKQSTPTFSPPSSNHYQLETNTNGSSSDLVIDLFPASSYQDSQDRGVHCKSLIPAQKKFRQTRPAEQRQAKATTRYPRQANRRRSPTFAITNPRRSQLPNSMSSTSTLPKSLENYRPVVRLPPPQYHARNINPNGPSYWATWPELGVKISKLPPGTTTRDLWMCFSQEGTIMSIDLYEDRRGLRDGKGCIRFRFILT